MKKLLMAAVASTAFMSTAAFAQSSTDSADLSVTATVNQECSIEDPTAVVFATVNINEAPGATALLLKNGSQNQSQNIYVSCNYAAKLSATSTNDGLLNAAGAAAAANDPLDFTNKIEYRVFLSSTDGSFPALDFRTRLEASESENAIGAFHNDALLRVEIDRDDNAKRPVAGSYVDTAVLTLGPI